MREILFLINEHSCEDSRIYDSPPLRMFTTPTLMAYKIERKVMTKNTKPPTREVPLFLFRNSNSSSFVLGSIPTNRIPLTCMAVVSMVKFTIPSSSPASKLSRETSQLSPNQFFKPSRRVEMALLTCKAELLIVVNMAYDAPSDPSGQRFTI